MHNDQLLLDEVCVGWGGTLSPMQTLPLRCLWIDQSKTSKRLCSTTVAPVSATYRYNSLFRECRRPYVSPRLFFVIDFSCTWIYKVRLVRGAFSRLTERCTLLRTSNHAPCPCEQFGITNMENDEKFGKFGTIKMAHLERTCTLIDSYTYITSYHLI